MIALSNASKSYWSAAGETRILDDVSLDLPPGENIGILGRNGAGKSTLLRILAGIEKLDEGEVISTARVSWPLGFTGGFHPMISGEENCHFVARIYGRKPDDIIDFVQDFSELGDYMKAPMRTYSSGMRARLAFAISMAVEFEIYLIDEVTAVGDRPFQKKCRAAFAARRARSNVIVVSHSLRTIEEYCRRAAVLHDGALTFFDSVAEANDCYQAVAM
jgi:capsular polysaccharide transport system ATP-binding protein